MTARSRRRWWADGSGGEGRAQLLRSLLQVLVHDLHVADHRHEVGVAVPPRNHVKMNVVGDARAGRAPEVRPHVEALWLERLTQHAQRSEEHTSELQSRSDLVCRLLLEK